MKFNTLKCATVAASLLVGYAATDAKVYVMKVTTKQGDTKSVALNTVSHLKVADAQKGEMHLNTTGKTDSIKLAELDSVAVNPTKLTVVAAGKSTDHNLADLTSVTFDLTGSTGIADVTLGDVTVAVNGGVLTATSATGTPVAITVYNAAGIRTATATDRFDFNAAASGVYIVKVADKTIKVKR